MACSDETSDSAPASGSYRHSHLAEGKGDTYDSTFRRYPHRAMMWQLEKECLAKTIRKFLPASERRSALDFACGTGRVTEFLASEFDHVTGVDVSESMLEVATRKAISAKFIRVDLTRTRSLEDETYDMITAFRFFANAENALRTEALTALVKRMRQGSILVFNNHKNRSGITTLLLRALKREYTIGMSIDEVRALMNSHDLKVVRKFCLGILPVTDRHPILPVWLTRPIEWVLRCIPFKERLAQNIVYVCMRQNGRAGYS